MPGDDSMLDRRAMLGQSVQALAAAAVVSACPFARAAPADVPGAIGDAHVHLSGTGTVEQRVDRLLMFADRMRIERLVVFMGTRFVQDPSPEELRQQNDEVWRCGACAEPDARHGVHQPTARGRQPGRTGSLRRQRTDGGHQAVGRHAVP